ncbi:protein SOB FIVE-LIKE 2 [Rosa chinensis]|nr:protein SOB FIVE-LIKE 2 [Rosa chinensis]
MESSQVVNAEKWSGNGESGWTMYIASSIHGERHGVYSSTHDATKENKVSVEHKDDGEESDDSMASDASSGPSHTERSRSATRLRHAEKEGNVKKHSTKKKKKKNEITMIKGEKAEQEILLHKADSAASHI